MASIAQRLKRLGLALPESAPAMAAYSPVVAHGGIVYLSGQLPRLGDRIVVAGAVGREVSLEDARHGARVALLRGLRALEDNLGSLDRILRILKLNVYVQSAPDFTEQSAVADAASNLLCELFQEKGNHVRTTVGVAKLPKNASIELDLVAAIDS